jgi:hypothetical protein
MPCEVMLANMRFAYGRALELQALLAEIDTTTAESTEGYTALLNEVVRYCVRSPRTAPRTSLTTIIRSSPTWRTRAMPRTRCSVL